MKRPHLSSHHMYIHHTQTHMLTHPHTHTYTKWMRLSRENKKWRVLLWRGNGERGQIKMETKIVRNIWNIEGRGAISVPYSHKSASININIWNIVGCTLEQKPSENTHTVTCMWLFSKQCKKNDKLYFPVQQHIFQFLIWLSIEQSSSGDV